MIIIQCNKCGETTEPEKDGKVPPTWTSLAIVGKVGSYKGKAKQVDVDLHYCPECIDKVAILDKGNPLSGYLTDVE